MNPESKRPISIEDLLRVKRAERPPAEFWTEFDRQLRAKQLAALVAKRPWWQGVPRIFAGFSRYRIPLGATAVLAVTFISIRNYQNVPAQFATSANPAVGTVAEAVSLPSNVAAQPDARDGVGVENVAVDRIARDGISVPETFTSAVAVVTEPAGSPAREHSGVIPLFGSAGGLTTNSVESPRFAGSGMTVAQDNAAGLTRGLLGPARGFESRSVAARVAIEPLQQITPPSERSRAKLLTAMLSMTTTEAPSRPFDRAASKLSEERLYDQIHRFDARGAGVRMKF